MYPNGAYLTVHKSVGSLIDWYNIQFYNQGASLYATCSTTLTEATGIPGTSVFEIIASGIPSSKIVIGKPATGLTSDANNGFIDYSAWAECIAQAKAKGWDTGLSVWQWSHPPTDYVDEIWG
ncbi:glycoside hydrolase [Pseudohyphozyma bogoriensis]|nr:glycoside hydrolase [Pseudohyphozyma bogoriensis]